MNRKRVAAELIIILLCAVLYQATNIFIEKTRAGSSDAEFVGANKIVKEEKYSKNERKVLLCMGENAGEMFVSWEGDEEGPNTLRTAKDKYSLPVAETRKGTKERVFGKKGYRYVVRLTNLEEGEKYYYELGDGALYDAPRFFYVPKNDGVDVFAYLGDPQLDRGLSDYDTWGRMVADMYEENPEVEFGVIGGDMVNLPGRKEQWSGFIDNCSIFSLIPMMTVPGNHEGVTSNNTYKKIFHHVANGPEGEAFYWFERENCRFVMLDSSFLTKARKLAMGNVRWSEREREIEDWIGESLKSSRKEWNIVVVHHPIYGMHDMFTVSKELRERWLPEIKEGGANVVFCGHQHVYMRTQQIDGITHIMGVSGAKRSKYYCGLNEPMYSKSVYGSGPNYQIIKAYKDRLEIVSYNENSTIIDAAVIDKDVSLPYFQTSWWQ